MFQLGGDSYIISEPLGIPRTVVLKELIANPGPDNDCPPLLWNRLEVDDI